MFFSHTFSGFTLYLDNASQDTVCYYKGSQNNILEETA